MWGCKILCENLWWLWARQEQPILTLSANFARRGDSLLVVVRGLLLPPAVGPGCLLHPFAACSAAGEQRNILSPRQVPPAAVALRNAPAGAALCAPAVFAPRFARLRGDSLLVVEQGCYLHPFAACSAAGEQRNILSPRQVPPAAVALRNAPAGAALCAPAVFAPRFARLRGDSLLVVEQGCYLHPFAACSAAGEQRNILALRSGCFCTALRAIARHSRAGKKITFPQKRKSQKEAPDTAWGRNTAPWVLSQQDKPSRMDIMAQFTLSHMILIIVPCRDNGVNTTRNVAPRRIFCIFVSTFGQYVKTACKPLFSQRNISYRPSIFAAAIAALPLFYQSKKAAPPLRERLPLQTIRCHAFSFIFAEQSLHSAQHIVLLFISANLLVDIIVQFFYCVSPLCIIHVDLFPWLRWF